MKKILSLFERDEATHRVFDKIVEGCEWACNRE